MVRKPSNIIKRRQLKAYTDGMSAAAGKMLPLLEQKYRLRLTLRFWCVAGAIAAIAFAAGGAVGVAWVRSGIQGF